MIEHHTLFCDCVHSTLRSVYTLLGRDLQCIALTNHTTSRNPNPKRYDVEQIQRPLSNTEILCIELAKSKHCCLLYGSRKAHNNWLRKNTHITKYDNSETICIQLTRKYGRRGPGREGAVLKRDASRDGVSVTRVTLASAKAGTSRSGSAAAPRGGRKRGTPARRGENTSATKSTKQEGVRLRSSSTVGRVVGTRQAIGRR